MSNVSDGNRKHESCQLDLHTKNDRDGLVTCDFCDEMTKILQLVADFSAVFM